MSRSRRCSWQTLSPQCVLPHSSLRPDGAGQCALTKRWHGAARSPCGDKRASQRSESFVHDVRRARDAGWEGGTTCAAWWSRAMRRSGRSRGEERAVATARSRPIRARGDATVLVAQRMRPITTERPKALLQLVNTPLIEYALETLDACGVQIAYVVCASHADMVRPQLRLPHRRLRTLPVVKPASRQYTSCLKSRHSCACC